MTPADKVEMHATYWRLLRDDIDRKLREVNMEGDKILRGELVNKLGLHERFAYERMTGEAGGYASTMDLIDTAMRELGVQRDTL